MTMHGMFIQYSPELIFKFILLINNSGQVSTIKVSAGIFNSLPTSAVC